MTIFLANAQGPRGRSASAYQISPSIDVPNCWTAIITQRLRCAFQFNDPRCAKTGFPDNLPAALTKQLAKLATSL